MAVCTSHHLCPQEPGELIAGRGAQPGLLGFSTMKQGCHVLILLTYGLSGLLSETIEIHTKAASSLLHGKVCGSWDRRREAVREERGRLSWRHREEEADEQTQLEEPQLRSLSSQSHPTLEPPIPVPGELELGCVSAIQRVLQALGELLAAGRGSRMPASSAPASNVSGQVAAPVPWLRGPRRGRGGDPAARAARGFSRHSPRDTAGAAKPPTSSQLLPLQIQKPPCSPTSSRSFLFWKESRPAWSSPFRQAGSLPALTLRAFVFGQSPYLSAFSTFRSHLEALRLTWTPSRAGSSP